MSRFCDRRNFLKTTAALGAGFGLAHLGLGEAFAAPVADAAPNATKIGWRLGCQCWSFNKYTFFEAVDKNASLGLKVLEAFPGQKISKEIGAGMGPGLSADQRKEVLKKLADNDIKLVNFGVGGCGRGEFEFAKDMGIETLVSEPDPKNFDQIDKLCEEFGINVALHNHPKNSRYWNPDYVLDCLKDRSKRMGACADTGHWKRSGLNPIECLKKLEGKIISLHFKDLKDGHDAPWGTGGSDAKAMLAEIYRQKLQAVFSIEYEYNWTNSVPEIAQCVEFFNQTAGELAKG